MTISTGVPAPDAVVFEAPRRPLHLRQLYDRTTVLLFFPMAFSSTCTDELCTMSDDMARYRDLDAHVFGISADSPYVNRHYAQEYNVGFPILSDFNREATRAFGLLSDLGDLRGVSRRSAFVVDAAGTIRYAWVAEDPDDLPPYDELRAATEGARQVSVPPPLRSPLHPPHTR